METKSISTGAQFSEERSMVLHAFADLKHTSPLFFVGILKQSYIYGKGKAVMKFQTLRRQVMEALPSAPSPGPSTYVMHCLNVLLLVDAPYGEGLSHLLTSALSSLDKLNRPLADAAEARKLAAQLFNRVVVGSVNLEERILIKVATVFDVGLDDLVEALYSSTLESEKPVKAKINVEAFILKLIRSRNYSSAVALLKQFSLQHSTPHEFLDTMIHDNQVEVAEQWASYMGKDMICSLVQHLNNMKMFKKAYNIVNKYKLKQEFPDSYYHYKRSKLKKLARKACWDIAEMTANDDTQLIQYLVALAFEMGDEEKATDICQRHSLTIPSCPVKAIENHYLQLSDFISEENVIWVDTVDELVSAAKYFTEVKVVGIDCEWRPNYMKGAGPSKVSILQIATAEKVLIFDLVGLSQTVPHVLDTCLKEVFHSPNILKLGYAFHNDLDQLFQSYRELECFHFCEGILDLQKLHGSSKGGLSGLTKTALGGHLNKTRRMSNWEHRPLTLSQLHYAALDAAVLIAIFNILCDEPSSHGSAGTQHKSHWKSHVTCCRTYMKHKKNSETHHQKADLAGASIGEVVDDQVSKMSMKQCEFVPRTDCNFNTMVASISDLRIPICCNSDTEHALEEDLVYTSCELLGLAKPGLLKSELQHYTQIADIPGPIYTVSKIAGPGNTMLFQCIVTLESRRYYGRSAPTKKAAEIWAALDALYHLGRLRCP
ncbi:uncharacterized protein LOC131065979 isoform X1 [Cryptomeria japonica]|uniref:uncharacterized protein LOC131065979 isoform X1 n=2 Tax=Cryptomeria japonica TaxID=3369 RepID=UPI0027DA5BB2|nr:uncharacterized protein LOC131065979 isoform X1 [Cryptomeria japonica]